jgi:hypothetical protein
VRKVFSLRLAASLPYLIVPAAAFPAGEALAQQVVPMDIRAELDRLKQLLEEQQLTIRQQQLQIEEQNRRLALQEREMEKQRSRLYALDEQFLSTARAGGPGDLTLPPAPMLAQTTGPSSPEAGAPVPAVVGQADPASPAERDRPEIEVLPEQGGVLTPGGTFVFEPSIEYSNSSDYVFIFRGAEIVDAILIGLIEASDADRNALTFAATTRWGVTDRLELEAKVPFVYRDDRISRSINIGEGNAPVTETQNLDGYGLGDVEIAAHYQFNDGRNGWPYFVGNLRFKTATGTGPFDVDRTSAGVATELATGTGFYSIEPSITAIYPSDPAVFFGNLSYSWNMEKDVDKVLNGVPIGTVDPGDSIGVSVGMGFSINPETSFSFGYKHNYIMETETEVAGNKTSSEDYQVGALLVGASYALSDSISLNLNVEAGVTEAAPDVRVLFRMPVRLGSIF